MVGIVRSVCGDWNSFQGRTWKVSMRRIRSRVRRGAFSSSIEVLRPECENNGLHAVMLNCACTFSQHELDFFYFDFSGRVSVVEVKSKNPKRRVGTRAEIPERKHEFFEVNLSVSITIKNWKYLDEQKIRNTCNLLVRVQKHIRKLQAISQKSQHNTASIDVLFLRTKRISIQCSRGAPSNLIYRQRWNRSVNSQG